MKLLLLAVGLCLVVIGMLVACRGDEKINKSMLSHATIIDVRTKVEYEGGHIAGAINIPLSKLRDTVLDFSKEQVLITYCSHGLRSKKAASILRARGFGAACDGGSREHLEQKMR